ncbi:unnamed protein product, partial [Allacma fusca]
KELIH